MISASEALTRLQSGNANYVKGALTPRDAELDAKRAALASGQAPFAIILGCADSRVPVEMVFDQGPGDLFVVRVAGNIATPTQLGSVEFAVEGFGSPLIVVLGHTRCGAVVGTLAAVRGEAGDTQTQHLGAIVEKIRPVVEPLLKGDRFCKEGSDESALLAAAVRANVRATVSQLSEQSPFLAQQAAAGKLDIVGAEYSLETGVVEFLG